MLTVGPLVVVFALEVGRLWPALGGASAFAAASPMSWLGSALSSLVVFLALAAYVAGWRMLETDRDRSGDPYSTLGTLRLQRWTGALVWMFVLGHLGVQWVMLSRVGPVSLSHYELLRDLLSRPVVMALYVFGLAAFGLFASQGLSALLRSLRGRPASESSRWIDVGCTLLAAIMVLFAVNLVSHFATGRAYWSGSPNASDAPTRVGAVPPR